jgi:hypothetical protein
MEEIHMMPEFQEAIITRLRQWWHANTTDQVWTDEGGIQAVIDAQDNLGWHNSLMGRISVQWRYVQQCYFVLLGHRNTGR